MDDEILLIQLRDCFTGGYTLPQFCIDNGIKKPLFVAEIKFWQFVWEIYVQFRYDKRLTAQFTFLDSPTVEVNFSTHGILGALKTKNIAELTADDFDRIIFLTTERIIQFDSVIYLDTLTDYFVRKTYCEIPLLHFLQRYPKVKLFLTNFPQSFRYKDSERFTKQFLNPGNLVKKLRTDKVGNVKTQFDKFGYTNEQVLEILEAPQIKTHIDGSTVMIEPNKNSLLQIKDGKRVTANQPEKFLNKIYFVGACHHYGVGAPFDKTIESYLQKMLNENNLPYRVENEGQRYCYRYQDVFYNFNKLTPVPGDIIFIWIDNMSVTNIPFIDVSDAFDPPHDYKEIFTDTHHVNELGYKILAEKYFKLLTENNFFRSVEFKYPPPVYLLTDTVYLRNSSRAA